MQTSANPAALLALLLLASCGDSSGPQDATFGTVALRVGTSCGFAENVQVWIDDTDRTNGDTPIPYPNALAFPNVKTGQRRVIIFRRRFGTEGDLQVTVKTGAETGIRLDCPDGYSIANP